MLFLQCSLFIQEAPLQDWLNQNRFWILLPSRFLAHDVRKGTTAISSSFRCRLISSILSSFYFIQFEWTKIELVVVMTLDDDVLAHELILHVRIYSNNWWSNFEKKIYFFLFSEYFSFFFEQILETIILLCWFIQNLNTLNTINIYD